ncbi:MAG: hypothetical protein L0Y73_05275 [Candidatus Aminicenantes bacterium]|nr:hypothetical protein [Candidatus Aminicenantes bacterium]
MLIFRTHAAAKNGSGYLTGSLFLASLLKKKIDIVFCIEAEQNKEVVKYLQEKKIAFCRPQELPPTNPQGVIFYTDEFAPADKELLRRAKENHIKTVHLLPPGIPPTENICDYTLSGPLYALLHSKYRHFNKINRKYRKRIANILISLEDTQPYRELRKIIDLLYRQRIAVKIAAPLFSRKSSQKILKRIFPGIRFVGKTESLARPFFEADLALIIPAPAAYEAAAAGVPALYLPCSPQQAATAGSFERENLGVALAGISDITAALAGLSLEKRIAIGQTGKKLIDARGAYRIIDFLKEKGIM